MSKITLDNKVALIVIDLQKGIVTLPVAHPAKDIIQQSNKLIDQFHAKQQTVVLVNVAGRPAGRTAEAMSGTPAADWSELVPELHRTDRDILATKYSWGAFTKTKLDETLKAQGISQVIVVGISTGIGVETTARQAFELGYNVAIVTDAITDTDVNRHNNSVERIFPRLGELCTTDELLALLA